MQISASSIRRALTVSACAFAAAAPASAAPVTADLRVEAGGKSLTTIGSSFVTDTTRATTDRRCNGSGKQVALQGPNATGLLVDAARTRPRLSPIGLSDEFSFGLLVCGVGEFRATDTAFWLYKVNHVAPEVSGEQLRLKAGDEVLWYLQDTTRKLNTGDELDISVPARARTGRPFTVTVHAFDGAGKRTPAAGADVLFGSDSVKTDSSGRASVKFTVGGSKNIRAGRGSDIPSPVEKVCVARRLSDCSALRGRRIFGRPVADRISGTARRDVVSAAGGADTIDVRGGGSDKVRCGGGRDTVRLGRGDRAARDCESVR